MKLSQTTAIATLMASTLTVPIAANPFFGDPPGPNHPWAVHDSNRPQPPRVVPGEQYSDAPSDALVLFDGTAESLENWRHELPEEKRKRDWRLDEGTLLSQPGAGFLETIQEFGDCQLHIEWRAPTGTTHQKGQQRSNSGVFFMGRAEVQVLDNYENPTYADGTAGAVYGVMPPAVNALRPAGEWQSYDIIFRRPIVRDGQVLDQGSLTVLLNGVVIQDSTPLEGGGGWKRRTKPDRVFPEKGRLKLQDHGNELGFRNIWIRPLRPRAVDGGFDGYLSEEATLAKRAEIAASVREDATEMSGIDQALRLLESLIYEQNNAAAQKADQLVRDYLEQLDPSEHEAEKNKILRLHQALTYLNDHGFIPADYMGLRKVDTIAIEQGWKE